MSVQRSFDDTTEIDISDITDISLISGLSEGMRYLTEKSKSEEFKQQNSGYQFTEDFYAS